MIKFKIIYRYIATSLCMMFIVSFLPAQSFNWVKKIGSQSSDNLTKMCTDISGNIYLAVSGGGPQVYFDNDTVTVNGLNDLFIVKYDASGTEVWKLHIGGPNTSWIPLLIEGIGEITYDSISNSIFFTGAYYETCTIDTVTLSTSPGNVTEFMAKIDLNGNCIWAKNFGGNSFIGSSPIIDIDTKGKIHFMFQVFNNSIFDSIPVTPGGYIGKMDTDGTILSIKKICGLYSLYQRSVYNFEKLEIVNDIIYVYGGSYDSLTLDTIMLPNNNFYSVLVSAWDTSGSILWAQQSDNSESGTGTMCVDNDNNIYIMDRFDGPYITFNYDTLFIGSARGVYILKLDKFGSLVWHKSYSTGGLGNKGALVDTEGNLYFTGSFIDSISFGACNLYSSTVNEEMFIARFDTSGICIGVRQAGSTTGNDIIENNNGEIYVAGTFRNTATFGPISIPSYGSSDMFLANLSAITGSGGSERIYNNQLIIYANPNKGSFRVQLPDVITDLRGALLMVYDVQGKEVARFDLTNKEENPQLEINNATSGFYTVRLVKENSIFTGKLVVE